MKTFFVGIIFFVALLHHSSASYSDEDREEDSKVFDEFNRQSDILRRQQGLPVRKGHFFEDDGLNDLPVEKYDPDFRNLQKPFRMAKLNLVWTKAQQRLTEPKLKSIYTQLKIHDKEELAYKQSKSKDTEGLEEAKLRKKLIGIMSTYGILEHFDETQDPENYKHHKAYSGKVSDNKYKGKKVFKDSKLNKLWEKAEVSGFDPTELTALRLELEHHQEKIDLYYSLLDKIDQKITQDDDHHKNAVNADDLDRFNEIAHVEDDTITDEEPAAAPYSKRKDYVSHENLVRKHHRELRDNLDYLERKAAKAPNSQEFIEPRVQELWRVASASNFTTDELASLKVEMMHYESRLLKLRHLNAELALFKEREAKTEADSKYPPGAKQQGQLNEHIKKQSRKVEKLQESIEERIYRHAEL